MEKGYPMDRLLCGDVGVGKTEVALRAAFKCIMGGKQCALLAPTTLLAWQHYNTLLSRMEAFPVKIGMLSRFRTAKQQKETLRGLQAGSVDIVVGTHRLLSKDVKFHDLGLVIIDEEQRFGVKHKEKLKENFIGVDMLTLSATPIPRTLNMAMSGIRDLSTIEQPPIERQPVETFVLEYNDVILAEAMKKELARGGQVYYLHNRVDNIEACAAHVSQMVPGARVGIAHGKMTEEELNPVWQHLLNGEIDILVCTTLIETGIDVRNCNTLIIEDADRMGLAQLYQIRGRVGRSGRKAYAYFTFRRDKTLTDIAQKRLLPSGSSPLLAPASASPCEICRSAARAVCWGTASTATWKPWATTSTSKCWDRPLPERGASPSSGTRAIVLWTCGWTPLSRKNISRTARAASKPTSALPPSRPRRTPPMCWTSSSTATATRRPR